THVAGPTDLRTAPLARAQPSGRVPGLSCPARTGIRGHLCPCRATGEGRSDGHLLRPDWAWWTKLIEVIDETMGGLARPESGRNSAPRWVHTLMPWSPHAVADKSGEEEDKGSDRE